MPLNILVTGANGFVGSALCPSLERSGHSVRRAVRSMPSAPAASPDIVAVGDIGADTDWRRALDGIDVVLHLAGRAHVMREAADVQAARRAYFVTNAEGTGSLARAAAASGVRRLVFVSSIKVNGETTTNAPPYTEDDPPCPEDDYGQSKWEAEQRLAAIGRETGLEHVVVRPPLVYGPGVKGNLARLMRIVDCGLPLPFGSIDNRRSLVGLTNLTSALEACAVHPGARGRTFLISDGHDLSTPELVRCIAAALGRSARLIPVPAIFLRGLAGMTRSGALSRLVGSLQVDNRRIRDVLDWHPPMTVEAEIARMTTSFASRLP